GDSGHAQSGGAGPRVRPRPRARSIAHRPAADQPEHLARLRRLQRRARARGRRLMRAPRVRALGFLRGGRASDAISATGDERVPTRGRPAPRESHRRATRECLLALAAVEAMLEDANTTREAIGGTRTGLVYATAAGYAASNRSFIDRGAGGIHFA